MTSNHDELPFYRALSQLKRSLIPVVLFSCVINLLMLVSPLYMLQVYDRVLISASHPTLLFLTLFAIAALMVLIALDSVRSLVLSRIGCRFENDVASYTFKNILERGGHSQPLRDIETLRSFLSSPAVTAIMDAPWTPLYLGLIYVLHPWLGHLALVGAIILFLLALLGESLTRKLQSESTSASGEAYRFTDICARQQSAIYAMGMAESLKAKWREPRTQSLASGAMATQRSGYISSISKGIRFSLQVGILGMGAFLVIQQESSPGVMIAASIIMGRGLAPIEACISGWRLVIQARDAKARLLDFQQHFAESTEPLPLPAPQGNLTVRNVIYQFDSCESPILKDISFQLRAGTVLGITGPNAAGKSTLGKLLLGLVTPMHGEVRLDNATYEQWDREQLGAHIGYLPQEVELFPGTIAENIARFKEASPEQIMQAGQLAGAHDMILHLEQGYNCAAGDFGEVLSGGQRQRVALARAVFGLPKLVLLDEPTSSLDADAERSVMKAILALKQQGTTVIVIGHRPALMNVTDQLLVLRDGRIAAYGETQEIMNQLVRPVVETKSN